MRLGKINRSGQIGQTITTIPVMIFVFATLLVFIIVVSFLGSHEEFNAGVLKKVNENKIFAEVFLNDFIVIDGEKINVEQMFVELVVPQRARYKPEKRLIGGVTNEEIKNLIVKKFRENYSCEDKNVFLFEQSGPFAKVTILASNDVVGNYRENEGVFPFGGHSKKIVLSSETYPGYSGGEEFAILIIKENEKCWK